MNKLFSSDGNGDCRYKNKKEKQVLTAFLSSLNISYRTEEDEEEALIKMYKKVKLKKEKAVPFDAHKLQQ